MKPFDWQSYLDGSLSEQDKVRHDAYLADGNCPEFEGLKKFCHEVKRAGSQEPVPTKRLEKCLKQATRRQGEGFSFQRVAIAFAGAFIVLMLAFWVLRPVETLPEMDLRQSAKVGESPAHTSVEGATWLTNHIDRPVPKLSLAHIGGQIEKVSCGTCWVAYDFSYHGETYTVYGRQEPDPFTNMTEWKRTDRPYYRVQGGIGWRCIDNMTMLVVGGNEQGRWEVAQEAAKTSSDRL